MHNDSYLLFLLNIHAITTVEAANIAVILNIIVLLFILLLKYYWNVMYIIFSLHTAWDQSDKFMKLYITLKNVQTLEKDKISVKFDER